MAEQVIFDPATLWSNFAPSDALKRQIAGREMTVDEVVDEFLDRMNASGDKRLATGLDSKVSKDAASIDSKEFATGGMYATAARTYSALEIMLKAIAEAMPSEYRNAGFIAAADLRPWLEQFAGKRVRVDNVTFDLDAKAVQEYVDAETYRLQVVAEESVDAETPEERKAQVDKLIAYGETPDVIQTVTVSADGQVTYGDEQEETAASAEDLWRLFNATQSNDILDLTGMLQESSMLGAPEPNVVTRSLNIPGQAMPEQLPIDLPLSLNWRSLGEFLYTGKITPTQMTRMQRQMAAAGLFDSMPEGYTTGDVFDRNTNLAWRGLVAEAYRRKMSLPAALQQLKQEREARMPDLRSNLNRRVFNALSQQLIGRDLSDSEQENLISYLRTLNAKGPMGVSESAGVQGFSDEAVGTYVSERFEDEVEGLGSIRGTNAMFAALREAT